MFQNSNDLVQCEKCNAKIFEKAWEVHRIMCDRQQKSIKPSQTKKQQIKNEVMIPCEQCGQNIPFELYEFHDQQCLGGQQTTCRYCGIKFPTFLMCEHNKVCELKDRQEEEDDQPYETHSYNHSEGSYDNQDYGGQSDQQQPHQNLGMLISTLAIGDEKQKQKGLTKKQIDMLPVVTVIKAEQCSICCTMMKRTDRNIRLNCKHVFHKLCLDPWLAQNPNCPMCRRHALKK